MPLQTMSRRPTIEWQTNGVCNYDCSYCIQSRQHRQGYPSDDTIERFLAFFAQLPGAWEIKMSGGEPFALRGFMTRIIPGLAALPHHVSVLTNFSAPLGVLRRFVDFVGDKLEVFSASLHLEYVEVGVFVKKAVTFRSWLRPETTFVVNNVLVPGTVAALVGVKAQVEAAGLKYFPQVMKTKQGVYAYDAAEAALVKALIGERPTAREANVAPSYKGRRCWAGAAYFVVDQFGQAFRCRTAKRCGEGYLGNVLDGTFRLAMGPEICRYDICPCTVPANRGMIDGISPGRQAEEPKQ